MTGGYSWLLWDAASVVVLGVTVWYAASCGFLRALIRFAGYILALMLSRFFAPMLAQGLYDHIVREILSRMLLRKMQSALNSGSELLGDVPESLLRMMDGAAVDTTSVTMGSELTGVVDTLIDAALQQPILSLLSGVCFLFVFSLSMIGVRLASRLLRPITRLPLLGGLDTLLGGVLGVVQAAILLLLLALLAQILIALSGGGWPWLNEDVIEQSYVFRVFYRFLFI